MPTTTPALPAGLPRTVEYSDPRAWSFASVDTVLCTEHRWNDYGRVVKWTLTHRTDGYTPAGSCMRLQEREVWRVTASDGSATYGQAFRTLPEAQAWLEQKGELA